VTLLPRGTSFEPRALLRSCSARSANAPRTVSGDSADRPSDAVPSCELHPDPGFPGKSECFLTRLTIGASSEMILGTTTHARHNLVRSRVLEPRYRVLLHGWTRLLDGFCSARPMISALLPRYFQAGANGVYPSSFRLAKHLQGGSGGISAIKRRIEDLRLTALGVWTEDTIANRPKSVERGWASKSVGSTGRREDEREINSGSAERLNPPC
jgi:hypothetical protein